MTPYAKLDERFQTPTTSQQPNPHNLPPATCVVVLWQEYTPTTESRLIRDAMGIHDETGLAPIFYLHTSMQIAEIARATRNLQSFGVRVEQFFPNTPPTGRASFDATLYYTKDDEEQPQLPANISSITTEVFYRPLRVKPKTLAQRPPLTDADRAGEPPIPAPERSPLPRFKLQVPHSPGSGYVPMYAPCLSNPSGEPG